MLENFYRCGLHFTIFSSDYLYFLLLDLIVINGARARTHTHTHTHTVGLLWTRDRPEAETPIGQHTTLNKHQILLWGSNPHFQKARGHELCLTSCGHRVRPFTKYKEKNLIHVFGSWMFVR